MATHPIQTLMGLIKTALEADASVGLVGEIQYMVHEDWVPNEAEFPMIGITDEGAVVERGPGRDEATAIGIVIFQEIVLDEKDATSLMGYGLGSPTIQEKGALELAAEVRAVLDGQALTGYWQGTLLSSSAPEVVPVDARINPDGTIAGVRAWVVKIKETFEYVKRT
jgi:hypothetical protein